MTTTPPFQVALKSSAVECNDRVAQLREQRGQTITYASFADAERDIAALNTSGDRPLHLQPPAPQDDTDLDAYLVAGSGCRTTCARTDSQNATFDVTANQRGAIGEALLLCYRYDPPAITEYIRSELAALPTFETDVEDLVVEVESSVEPIVVPADDGTETDGESQVWIPDCRLVVHDGRREELIRTYACEVKTGAASLARDQETVMRHYAASNPVLLVQFDLQELPTRYAATVTAFHRKTTKRVAETTNDRSQPTPSPS